MTNKGYDLKNDFTLDCWILEKEEKYYHKNDSDVPMEYVSVLIGFPHPWKKFLKCTIRGAAFSHAVEKMKHVKVGDFVRISGQLGYVIFQKARFFSMSIQDVHVHSEQIPIPQVITRGREKLMKPQGGEDNEAPF